MMKFLPLILTFESKSLLDFFCGIYYLLLPKVKFLV